MARTATMTSKKGKEKDTAGGGKGGKAANGAKGGEARPRPSLLTLP